MAKECITCKQFVIPVEKKLSECYLSDFGGAVFSFPIHRPSSKGHTNVVTKRHCEDIRQMTTQEWADILPVLKDTIKKVDLVYKPLGYRLSIPNGKAANQNQPFHFYMRVVPKYKKDYGNVSIILKHFQTPDFKKNKEKFEKTFLINSEKMISEKGKLIARLHDGKEINTFTNEELVAIIAISTKAHLPNDIQAIDQETWNEIGQVLKELMKKMEDANVAHDFSIELILGKEAAKIWREEADSSFVYPDSELVILLYPRYEEKECWRTENRPVEKSGTKIKGSMENERIAKKLRDPEEYAKIWGKKPTPSVRGHEEATNSQTKTNLQNQETKAKESIWKQPSTYLLIASGIGICLLGMGIYWLFSKKTKAKS
jgi:diadenosine tetraphosphate (Ap4A) HIT family hydrolase